MRMALTTPVSILTGGPGTGKTHTLKAVLMLAQAKQLRCLLAAPTGRAAKRMEEATGLPAVTLHRLLDLRPGSKSADKTLQADLVVVDEVSMLDVLLDDGREVCYPYASAYALTHAYAATVHRVQGSEFPAVVIVLLTSHATMLGRTLVYTALTRARRLAVFVGQKRALALAVRDWRRTTRQTALAELLVDGLRFSWPEVARGGAVADDDAERWEGLLEAAADPPV